MPERKTRAVLECDVETGLHYNRFRYFDPDLGMFISRDPIGLIGGSNTFQYAPNPTGWVDPLGLSSNLLKEDRKRRFSSKSQVKTKHTQGKTLADAKSKSLFGKEPAAQYWKSTWDKCECKTMPEVTAYRNQIEKEGLQNGILVDSGKRNATDYYIYDAKRDVGYNLGKPTQYMRIEVDDMNFFHGHPISRDTYNTLLKKRITIK